MARGTLRIFLGSAPGVGKTYAMLREGHRLREGGEDVVVAFARDRGRRDTRALLAGLELIPAKRVPYQGLHLEELDLDAVIRRGPATAIVDDYAHANPPDSRNAHRWQDVDELLDAGINVLSTLDIQHLASLSDVVSAITDVRPAETVPDEVARRAGQIQLVDISPELLRQRLADGKIVAADRVDAALANYYRPGNLAALRELALLWLADRVDEGLARYRTGKGIEASWPARERIVVGLPGGPEGEIADPPRCTHPQPGQRRRPAGGARTRSGNCGRGIAAGARGTATPGPGPWRQLSPGGRGRSGRRAAGLRPQRQRHPDRRRNLTPRQPGRPAGGPSRRAHRRQGGPRRRRHRRSHRVPAARGRKPGCAPAAGSGPCPRDDRFCAWPSSFPALLQLLLAVEPGQESGDCGPGPAHRLRRRGAGRWPVARDPRGALEQPAGELLLHPAGRHPHHQRFAERPGPPGVCRGVRRRRHRGGPLRAAVQGSGPRQGGGRHPGGPLARGAPVRRTRLWACWSRPWTSSRSGARPF